MKIKKLEYILKDGVHLALHSFVPPVVKRIVFYFHGIQSHAGWLFDVFEELAARSIAIYVLDRRGAGRSFGLRGDIYSSEDILEDYHQALTLISQRHALKPINLFGHCLGGSILAALIGSQKLTIPIAKVMFCSAGLGRLHQQFSPTEQNEIANTHSLELVDINLKDELFTSDNVYLEFMKNDYLSVRKMTKRSRATLLALEKLYFTKKNIIPYLSVYLSGVVDPIVDLAFSKHIFNQLTDHQGEHVTFDTDEHYLFFTQQRNNLMTWISDNIC